MLMLKIDGKPKNLGRFRRRERIDRQVLELNRYKGYKAEVIDTKWTGKEH